MDSNIIPPNDPPALGSTGTVTANSPTELPGQSTSVLEPKPKSENVAMGPVPASLGAPSTVGSTTLSSQPVAPTPDPVSPTPAPTLSATPSPTPTNPNVAVTTTDGKKTNFGMFIGVFIVLVILIWVGVGYLYYSNQQLEAEIASTSSPASVN